MPGGVDLAVEASGQPVVMNSAINAVRAQGGRAVVIGNAKVGNALTLDPAVFNQGKSLLGTWGGDSVPDRDYPRFGKLLASERFPVRDLLSAPYRLDQASQALEDLSAGRVGRPMIEMSKTESMPMRIGIDFDNTIANYDGVFHAAAVERRLIPADIATGKNAVRDYLNGSGRKEAFTELQGYVYGARMDLVSPYPDAADFVAAAVGGGHDVYVISHKTRTPMSGPPYDMHAAARGFLEAHGFVGPGMIPPEHTFFELTKEDKVARAAAVDVHIFVDDLPEILIMNGFPSATRRILFDPLDGHAAAHCGLERFSDWRSIRHTLLS